MAYDAVLCFKLRAVSLVCARSYNPALLIIAPVLIRRINGCSQASLCLIHYTNMFCPFVSQTMTVLVINMCRLTHSIQGNLMLENSPKG